MNTDVSQCISSRAVVPGWRGDKVPQRHVGHVTYDGGALPRQVQYVTTSEVPGWRGDKVPQRHVGHVTYDGSALPRQVHSAVS